MYITITGQDFVQTEDLCESRNQAAGYFHPTPSMAPASLVLLYPHGDKLSKLEIR
jgi:hypothetical protein